MTADRVRSYLEISPKKAFAAAIDWPGWCRASKTEDGALEALAAYASRYAPVAIEVGLELPNGPTFEVVEQVPGGSGTEFGVPSVVVAADREPLTAAQAGRLADLVAAAWITFDRVVAAAPAELRKGPRGGGRDRDKIVAHVIEADRAYAHEIGVRVPPLSPDDGSAVAAMRREMLAILRRPSDGTPLAARHWTPAYATRRIAWHALDHAWEMEDRTER